MLLTPIYDSHSEAIEYISIRQDITPIISLT